MGARLVEIDRIATINDVIADLGSIVRRSQAGSLDQDGFYELTNRMRRNLKTLRLALNEDELTIELPELGAAIGQLIEAGQITVGSSLRLPEGVDRARTYGHLAVIDGGAGETPSHTQGA